MVQTSFTLNIFDICVITVIALSAMVSFYRGFMREVLSLGSWVGAALIALYSFPTVSEWIEPQVKSQAIASGLASIGVFMVALVSISILTGIMMKFVKESSEVGYIDNMVGLAFGVARGVLLVSVAYFVMTLVMSEKDYPDWLEDSYSRPYVAKTAAWVAELTPSYLDTITGKVEKDAAEDEEKPKVRSKKDVEKKRVTRTDSVDDIDEERDSFPSLDDLQKRVHDERG